MDELEIEQPNRGQLFFFLFDSTTSPKYSLGSKILKGEDVRKLQLTDFLDYARVKGSIDDFAFFLFSQSMKSPLLLPSDHTIFITWLRNCMNDSVVTIHVRQELDESPAETLASSYSASLKERRLRAGKYEVPEYLAHSESLSTQHEAKDIVLSGPSHYFEPYILSFVGTLNDVWVPYKKMEDARIYIDTGDGEYVPFTAKWLVMTIKEGWENDKEVTDVEIPYWRHTEEGLRVRSVKLSKKIWDETLLDGPWKELFKVFRKEEGSTVQQVGKEPLEIQHTETQSLNTKPIEVRLVDTCITPSGLDSENMGDSEDCSSDLDGVSWREKEKDKGKDQDQDEVEEKEKEREKGREPGICHGVRRVVSVSSAYSNVSAPPPYSSLFPESSKHIR